MREILKQSLLLGAQLRYYAHTTTGRDIAALNCPSRSSFNDVPQAFEGDSGRRPAL